MTHCGSLCVSVTLFVRKQSLMLVLQSDHLYIVCLKLITTGEIL